VSAIGVGAERGQAGAAARPGTRERAEAALQRVLVLGGTSEIGLAIVREVAARGPCEALLIGRDAGRLGEAARELQAAGCARALAFELDALAREQHAEVLDRAFAELGRVDLAIIAVGVLGERGGMPQDVDAAVELMDVDFVAAGSLLLNTVQRMVDAGCGTVAVLSSVAAERPRRANVVYGAAKAGLDALARGIGDDVQDSGVRVLVVRPGFVHTKMTRGLQPAPLACAPQQVAGAVLDGLGGNAQVVWAPRSLRWVMLVIRHLPRFALRRLPQ
jgi:decaprenylphospho-beta-D-erythro-pentofuranosid-2-ulose 2-reductase